MNAGNAQVARGEPLVWLAGGALVFTILMIVGLLILVLCRGMETFWPQPLVRLALRDGSVVLGEITAREPFVLKDSTLKQLPSDEAGEAREFLAGRAEAQTEREFVRVENFDLTQLHYRWIWDYEIAPDGRSYPEWGVVLERYESGRFYGEPAAFIVRHPRTPTGDEEQLARIVTFFEENILRLEEPAQAAVQKQLDALKIQLKEMQQKSGASLLDGLKTPSEHRVVEVVLENGTTVPADAVPANGLVVEAREVWKGASPAWAQFVARHDDVRALASHQRELVKNGIGPINRRLDESRLSLRAEEIRSGASITTKARDWIAAEEQLAILTTQWDEKQQVVRQTERRFGGDSPEAATARKLLELMKPEFEAAFEEPRQAVATAKAAVDALPPEAVNVVTADLEVQRQAAAEAARINAEIDSAKRDAARFQLQMRPETGKPPAGDDATASSLVDVPVANIVRGYPANQLSLAGKLGVYAARWWEFLSAEPREANSEGGVFPAIWGTVTMTLIMSLAVVPFGVLAALYLREYARGGFIVSVVRIAVNNLAGVPSIVFGVFGFGFFCYLVGAYVDGGPRNASIPVWPPPTWFFALGALAVTALLAFLLGLFSLTSRKAEASRIKRWMGRSSLVLWLTATVLLVLLIARTPFFGGFYATSLPGSPTFGKGGLLWASLTLSLMTLPVVIVATEEALSAVPNSMREGSYACGASKWQTIQRIILPRALPGVMTGMILAMARGAGEVAPLMLVGAVKFSRDLPVDTVPPFLHPERSFMHLGFHIYDLGFQSQNSEAATPMVFTTTLLLITIVALLNLAAIWLRARLRRRYKAAQF